MRNYDQEVKRRVSFIQKTLQSANASGIVYGNSGGKDSALVGMLCKMACNNTMGVIMPCSSQRNYNEDKEDAEMLAELSNIETRFVDLSNVKTELVGVLDETLTLSDAAISNVAPRLRMITLYTIAASENRLVAGTGNRSEGYMGYFTKWGDGAFDFNPIADLTVTEMYEFLKFLNAPERIIKKAPSAGLFDGQSDEKEMGIAYADIDNFLLHGTVTEENKKIMDKYHSQSEHKRKMPAVYS